MGLIPRDWAEAYAMPSHATRLRLSSNSNLAEAARSHKPVKCSTEVKAQVGKLRCAVLRLGKTLQAVTDAKPCGVHRLHKLITVRLLSTSHISHC